MKKIPTLFKREFENDHIAKTLPIPSEGLEYIAFGAGTATVKVDGACCAIIDGEFYKRYDAKRGKNGKTKKIPDGAIKCQDEPDPITGHMPCWVRCENDDPSNIWFIAAYRNMAYGTLGDGTYEAIGPHFQSNPYGLEEDILYPHGSKEIYLPDHSYDSIKKYLVEHPVEGIVFWDKGVPVCKIKRSDFGISWPAADKNFARREIADNYYFEEER